MNTLEYKKTYPAYLLATIWLTMVFLFCFFVYHISGDTEIFVFGGIMTFIAIICILLHIFNGKSVHFIQNNTNHIIIKYKKGRDSQILRFEKNDIEKLLFNFNIKAHSKKEAGFYNYICMDINVTFKNGNSIKFEDEYVMNGLVLHVGKNIKQIYSIKHIVNMFKNFDKFSYNIKNIHAIYDKRYEPDNIKTLLQN